MSAANLLIVADSERDANMFYAVGMFVPDPFVYLRIGGRNHLILNELEIDRARREAPACQVLCLGRYLRQLRREGVGRPSVAQVIRRVAREKRVGKFLVPATFPYGLARELRRLKVRVKVKPGSFFPEREVKSAVEVKRISGALIMAEVGMAEALQALRNTKIGPRGRLLYHQVPLTAEKLRAIIDTAILQAGGLPAHTIVAGGRQSCFPHEPGHGPLWANQPIILDIFPRSQKTGYFGDITRTVVRGRATEGVRRMHHTVRRAQELALGLLRPKTRAAVVDKAVRRFIEGEGFPTRQQNGRCEGFCHGTGHGLGLELHEAPQVSAHSEAILRAGNVVTVEPGLYYPGLGGVRLEDVACLTPSGARNLTKFDKVLEV